MPRLPRQHKTVRGRPRLASFFRFCLARLSSRIQRSKLSGFTIETRSVNGFPQLGSILQKPLSLFGDDRDSLGRFRYPAEMRECILQGVKQVVGRLRERRLAVRLAAVNQREAKDVCLPARAVSVNHRRAGAEIDLGLCAWSTFHPAERQGAGAAQTLDESPHAVVTDATGIPAQILVNPLGG